MSQDKKDNKNIILVAVIIGVFLIFMLGTVIYTVKKIGNCSSGKKLREVCTLTLPDNGKIVMQISDLSYNKANKSISQNPKYS